MDVAAMAAAVPGLLSPFLPLLKRIGATAVDRAIEEAGNRISAEGWKLAKAVWSHLCPRVADDPALMDATEDLAARPGDPAAQQALQHQLKRVLANDSVLLRELNQLVVADTASHQT